MTRKFRLPKALQELEQAESAKLPPLTAETSMPAVEGDSTSDAPPCKYRLEYMRPALRAQFERKLSNRDFKSIKEASAWLKSKGIVVRDSSVWRYRINFERRLEALRQSTMMAREICKEFPLDDISIQESLLRNVQSEFFQLLNAIKFAPLKSQRGRKNAKPPNIHEFVRSVSNLAKTQITFTQFGLWLRERVKQGVDSTRGVIDKAAIEGGLDAKIAHALRESLEGIKL